MDICSLLIDKAFTHPKILNQLFLKIFDLFIYQSGQFPHLNLLQNSSHEQKLGEIHSESLKTEFQNKKELQYLDLVREIKSHLLDFSDGSVCCFLLMLGGLPTKPSRAVLIDFRLCSSNFVDDQSECSTSFTDLFGCLIQHPIFSKAFKEVPPTRLYIYLCGRRQSSSWFLPRINFRLSKSCPLFLLQVKPRNDDLSLLIEHEQSHDISNLTDIVYNCHIPFTWYASPVILHGIR